MLAAQLQRQISALRICHDFVLGEWVNKTMIAQKIGLHCRELDTLS